MTLIACKGFGMACPRELEDERLGPSAPPSRQFQGYACPCLRPTARKLAMSSMYENENACSEGLDMASP